MIIVEIELLIIGDKTEIKKYINRFSLKQSRYFLFEFFLYKFFYSPYHKTRANSILITVVSSNKNRYF